MDFAANILLLGKTGAGKSSFINYFIGREVAKIGKGKPVTQEDFEVYELEVNGESSDRNNAVRGARFPVCIHDSRGLEHLSAHKQLDYIKSALKKTNEGDVSSWFHTIFYCINAGSGRFEEFEVAFAKALQEALNQPIYFILTHCDSGDEKKIAALKTHIKKNLGRGVKIFEVVSVNMAKRVGKAEQKGVENVRECVFDLLVDSLALRLSKQYAKALRCAWKKAIEEVFAAYERYVEGEIGFLCSGSLKEQKEKMLGALKSIIVQFEGGFKRHEDAADEELSRVLFPALQLYAACYGIFGLSKNYHSALGLDFSSTKPDLGVFSELFDYENVAHKITPNTAKESAPQSVGEMVSGFFAFLQDSWNLNENVKDFIDKARRDILDALPSQEVIEKEAKKRLVRFLTKPRR